MKNGINEELRDDRNDDEISTSTCMLVCMYRRPSYLRGQWYVFVLVSVHVRVCMYLCMYMHAFMYTCISCQMLNYTDIFN